MFVFVRAALAAVAILCALVPPAHARRAERLDPVRAKLLVARTGGTLTAAQGGAAATAASARRRGVRFVERNHRYRAAGTPADELFGQQWALAEQAVLGAPEAWDQTTGGDVTVAVIDSGTDLGHPDLRDNLWANPGEVPGNGADDDANGRVDDVHGWDFVSGDGDPGDDNGHGTHVAGIIGARGGNRVGVTGVAWRARIMSLKALDGAATGSALTLAQAVRYATAHGARIVNLSVAGAGRSRALEEAIDAANAAGVVVVASAGNSTQDLAVAPVYPAAYPQPNVVAVAATSPGGGLASMSNFGAGVDVAAPGADVVSTARGGGYERRSGTSMAAPHVAGALVLMAAARPDLPLPELEAAVLAAARRGGLPVATGSLDLVAALRRVIPESAWKTPPGAAPPATAAPATSRRRPGTRRAARTTCRTATAKGRRAGRTRRTSRSRTRRAARPASVVTTGAPRRAARARRNAGTRRCTTARRGSTARRAAGSRRASKTRRANRR